MDTARQLKKRNTYLDKLIAFQDLVPIKVVTGIRRCGKSSLLQLMVQHLLEEGIGQDQILEMSFERFDFSIMSDRDFYFFVKERIHPHKRTYLFFDEPQRIQNWESIINSFRVEFNCDIYVTGSNAYMLSSQYATYLAGRYVEIKMLPLSFAEFVDFHGFQTKEIPNLLGGIKKQFIAANKSIYTSEELFSAYLSYGGMPGLVDVGFNQEKSLIMLDGIYNSVVLHDILEHEARFGKNKLTDPLLLKKLVKFLTDNIGNTVSTTNIGKTLVQEGLLADSKRSSTPATSTIQTYIDALTEAYLFYDIKRFDIKGKDYLRTLGKYYIVDPGLRNYLLGFRDQDRGHTIENVVYLELLRRGYDVAIGKVGNKEIDFIATKQDKKLYIQVTETMLSEDTRNRELAPLKMIDDNYEKIVLSLDSNTPWNDEGIRCLNLIEWLLS